MGWYFFPAIKKKKKKPQSAYVKGKKRQKLSNSFPWRDMRKETGSCVENSLFSPLGFLHFIIGPLTLYSHSSFDACSFLGCWLKDQGLNLALRFCALLGVEGSGKEQGLPAAPGSLSTSVTVPPLSGLYKKKSLFLGWEEQRAWQQDPRGWPALV